MKNLSTVLHYLGFVLIALAFLQAVPLIISAMYLETVQFPFRIYAFPRADPMQAAVTAGNGYFLFKGEVAQADWKIEEGFTINELTVSGQADDHGHHYRIWYKNEHIVSWFDDKPNVTVPDLICALYPKTGEAITNPNCRLAMDVVIIGYPAPAMWRLPKGLEVFGPKYFGYELPYRPIEENRRLG